MRREQVLALLRLGRFRILPGGFLAYVLGAAMGYAQAGAMDWPRALRALVLTLIANLSAHYADEYADVDTDSLTRRTWFSGGSGVLPSHVVPPSWALGMAWLCVGLVFVLGAWWITAGALPVACGWIVGIGMLGGWFYSMPPLAFERRGLGELVNATIGSFLMPLMGYSAQAGAPSLRAVWSLLPIFWIVMFSLLAVHWADRAADQAVGKRSLAVLAGQRARPLHIVLLSLCYLTALALTGPVLPSQVSIAVATKLPLAAWATVTFGRDDSPVPSSLTMAAVIVAAAVGWVAAAPGFV